MKTRALLASLALAAAGCSGSGERIPAAEAKDAPVLELPDLAGKSVKLADYKGKVVLLDFWATWCPPCVEEAPDLVELQKGAEDKYTILAVALEEASQADVHEFVSTFKLNYPVLYAEKRPENYRIRALPTAFLIDRKGRLRQKYLGAKDPAAVRRDIDELLKEEG